MADNMSVRDGGGFERSIATKEVSSGLHLTKHLLADETGAPIEPATEATLATVGTRAYDWASMTTVAIGATSAASAAVGADGEYELSADVDCYIFVGTGTPVATTSKRFLPAGAAFTVQLADDQAVAVIRKDTNGTLTILPVA